METEGWLTLFFSGAGLLASGIIPGYPLIGAWRLARPGQAP
jgi:hypothetical protein